MFITAKSFFKFTLSILFISCVFLSACEQEEEVPLFGEAKLRVINASPEDNEYSFFVNDSLKTGQALKYGEGSAYLSVSAGKNNVYTKVGDNLLTNTNVPLFLENSKNYTLFLAGKSAIDSLVYLSTTDDLTFISDTMATVRFINVSPNSPNLNLVFQTSLVDSVNVISSINYRSASVYRKIRPNTYFMRIKRSGSATPLANLDSYNLEAGKIYTFWAKGLLNTTGTYALALGVLKDN